MPSLLDCGGCLFGESKVWSTLCMNLGGEGKFKLMLPSGRGTEDTTMVSVLV